MPSAKSLYAPFRILLVILLVGRAASVSGQTVWSGLTKSFSKATGADHTLPANQDMLTSNVVLTRPSDGGMINLAAESSFVISVSPTATQWATDLNNAGKTIAATNWEDLTFTNWLDAYGGAGSRGAFIANRNAVVRLVPDNIYLDLRFTAWSAFQGGGYSYMRAEPPVVPSPTGDYNGNGVVDAADYVLWRDTLDQSVGTPGEGADGNANGTIDAPDYDFWRTRFGNVIPVPASGAGLIATMPEPVSAALCVMALFGLPFCLEWRLPRRNIS